METIASMTQELSVGNNNQVGYYSDNCWHPYDWDYYHYHYYPIVANTQTLVEDRVSKAFKIVQKLMEKKLIEKITISKFIELVNEIALIV